MVYQSIIRYWSFISWSIVNDRNATFAGTVLGSLWSFVLPIVQITIYYFLVKVVFRASVGQFDPFLIIAIGILHYTLINQIISNSCGSILSQSHVLLHIKVEPAVFVALKFLQESYKGIEYFIILAIVYLIMSPGFHWGILLYPFIVAAILLSLWGPSLILSMANVFYRDIANIVKILMQVTMYLSPVIYHFTFVPQNYWYLYFLNPLAGYLAWLQWSLLGGPMPPLWAFLWSLAVSVGLFLLSSYIYKLLTPHLTKRF